MTAIENFPEIRSLGAGECEALLARNHVGRLAFTFHDRVDVQPVHYVYWDGWIYLRTSEGEKVTTIMHHPWVAFEVDEVRGPFEWVSVVAHGSVYRIDARGPAPDPALEAEAVRVLRTVVPEMFTDADPVPHRNVLLRLAVKELTGRAAHPKWNRGAGARDAQAY